MSKFGYKILAVVKKRRTKILLGLLMVYCLVNITIKATAPALFLFNNDNARAPCAFQLPDPFDPSISKFHWNPQSLVCDSTPAIAYVDDLSTLRYNVTALKAFGVADSKDIVCEIREVVRSADDYNVHFSEAIISPLPRNLTSDFSRVTCKVKHGKVLYDNIVVTVVRNENRSNLQQKYDENFNIVLFGIDSVSRSASIRHLPKTRDTLKRLGAYDFKGYMKVGENTAPNLIPLLTGRRLEEWPIDQSMDYLPLIWKNFSLKGYRTLMGEDMPQYSTFTNYFKGFRQLPADHYMRPFYLAQNQMNDFKDNFANVYRFLEDKGMKVGKESVFCYQNTKKHAVVLNYIRQFMLQYKNEPKFSYTFLTELGHSFTNFLAYGDEDFSDLFKWMNSTGFLNNTILVVFSDHGPRYQHYRNTFVGRIESRMPFLSVIVPESLKQRYPNINKSLNVNTQRLVTLFDVHQMLADILNKKIDNPSKQLINGKTRGASLFQPLPYDRSCFEAGVPEEFCACYKSTKVNVTNNAKVERIAKAIVEEINKLVIAQKRCVNIALSRVLTADVMSLGLKHAGISHNGYSVFQFSKPEENRERFSVAIETRPGHAQFEATCELSSGTDVKIIGEIDRMNKYGNQSACLYNTNARLRPFCYCKH